MRFEQQMARYCTTYYTRQRDNEDRYPAQDVASRVGYALGQVATSQTTEVELEAITPPPAKRQAFTDFVNDSRQILADRVADVDELRATGNDDTAGPRLDTDVVARWPVAVKLGAHGCDGALPLDQQAAVVAAVRTFETSPDSATVCQTMLTVEDLRNVWPQYSDPVQGCIAEREAYRHAAVGLPYDIEVQSITGVEHIGATVYYADEGGCGCASNITRLHFVDGSWKVSEREHSR